MGMLLDITNRQPGRRLLGSMLRTRREAGWFWYESPHATVLYRWKDRRPVGYVLPRDRPRRAARIARTAAFGIAAGLGLSLFTPWWAQAAAGAVAGVAGAPWSFTLPLGIGAPIAGGVAVVTGAPTVSGAGPVATAATEAALHRGMFHGSRFWLGFGLGAAAGLWFGSRSQG